MHYNSIIRCCSNLNELNVLHWLVVSNPDDSSVVVSILVDVPVLCVDVSWYCVEMAVDLSVVVSYDVDMYVDLLVVVSYGDVTVKVVCCSVVRSGVDNGIVVSVVAIASGVVSRFPNVTGIVSPAESLICMYIYY